VDLAAAFPGGAPLDGVPGSWVWTHATTFGHCVVLSEDGKHVFHSYAHASYDEGLARAILLFCRAHSIELTAPRPLVVVEGFTHEGYGFDTVVAVAPAIHRYDADNPDLHEATRAVFPAYRCEFSGTETEHEAAYRYARAAGAQPTRWRREPNPYLKMRMRAATGRVVPERGFVNPPRLLRELAELPRRVDGFVEFENYERRVWLVRWDEAYIVTGDGAARRMDLDEVVAFATEVLRNGWIRPVR
jgi:hypothetical protein